MLQALIVEDDKFLASKIQANISDKFKSDICYDGDKGIDYIEKKSYDLIIADSILPKRSGISILQYIREKDINTPFLVLTIADSTDEKAIVMEFKSTEYISRFSDVETLNTTISNLLQRTSNQEVENEVSYEDLKIDLKNELVIYNDTTLTSIKGKYLELLSFFVVNNNIVLNKDEIFDRVWGVTSETTINAIEVYISGLRKELKKINFDKRLKTVRGIGYTFE